MKHTRLWIWLFAASAALNVLLYAQMIINNQKPPEAPIVKGTYARQEGGTLYRLAMRDDGYYCLYLAGEILELGRYVRVDENRLTLTAESPEELHGCSAFLIGETLYEILSDGSVQTYEKTVDIPYYDNVKPVWNDVANEK